MPHLLTIHVTILEIPKYYATLSSFDPPNESQEVREGKLLLPLTKCSALDFTVELPWVEGGTYSEAPFQLLRGNALEEKECIYPESNYENGSMFD